MPSDKPKQSPRALMLRRYLINSANNVARLKKEALSNTDISLVVHDHIVEAEKQLIKAYTKIPEV